MKGIFRDLRWRYFACFLLSYSVPSNPSVQIPPLLPSLLASHRTQIPTETFSLEILPQLPIRGSIIIRRALFGKPPMMLGQCLVVKSANFHKLLEHIRFTAVIEKLREKQGFPGGRGVLWAFEPIVQLYVQLYLALTQRPYWMVGGCYLTVLELELDISGPGYRSAPMSEPEVSQASSLVVSAIPISVSSASSVAATRVSQGGKSSWRRYGQLLWDRRPGESQSLIHSEPKTWLPAHGRRVGCSSLQPSKG